VDDLSAAEPPLAVPAVAALADRVRDELYRFVRGSGRPVTRDDAAASAGISRRLAAFHLDKLVDVGLLRARYERTGRSGSVGRSPKVYEPSGVELRVQLPERRYELLAEILLDALAESESGSADGRPGADGTPTSDGSPRERALHTARERAVQTAHHRGTELGRVVRPSSPGGRVGPERGLRSAEQALARCGYEPSRAARDRLTLTNCPFHRLAERQRDLVCGLNQAFCAGLLEGIGASAVSAVLVPSPPKCCVEVRVADEVQGVPGPGEGGAAAASDPDA
jgi:predicted ArsR family transcriptional regulator